MSPEHLLGQSTQKLLSKRLPNIWPQGSITAGLREIWIWQIQIYRFLIQLSAVYFLVSSYWVENANTPIWRLPQLLGMLCMLNTLGRCIMICTNLHIHPVLQLLSFLYTSQFISNKLIERAWIIKIELLDLNLSSSFRTFRDWGGFLKTSLTWNCLIYKRE